MKSDYLGDAKLAALTTSIWNHFVIVKREEFEDLKVH